jgi:hypothetical protein
MRLLKALADQPCYRTGFAAVGVAEDSEMAPEQAVRINAHLSVACERARTDPDSPSFA